MTGLMAPEYTLRDVWNVKRGRISSVGEMVRVEQRTSEFWKDHGR